MLSLFQLVKLFGKFRQILFLLETRTRQLLNRTTVLADSPKPLGEETIGYQGVE
jgi:hypothetical protein